MRKPGAIALDQEPAGILPVGKCIYITAVTLGFFLAGKSMLNAAGTYKDQKEES